MAEYVIMPKADYEAACNSIRAKTGKTDVIKSGSLSTEIDSITGGGGSSADVRYVTFVNDSTGESFVKPVATGDDCVDVVAKGLWATPTQESTAQYDYTHYGWGAEPNGAADANILKNITEDKTVYAIFSATVRMYTITWLDSDGVTELPGQKQWAYGSVPSYTPTKEGDTFEYWTPTPVAVTGDASYVAKWAGEITGTISDGAITWSIANNVLTFRGTGAMQDYSRTYNSSAGGVVTTAPWYAYKSKFTSVVIEEGITKLGTAAFTSMTNITAISFPSTFTGEWYAEYALESCKSITSVTYADGITHICGLFYGCTGLKTVTIPASAIYIDIRVFNGSGLTSATFMNTSGWWVTETKGAASGTAVAVTNASTAATYLKSTHGTKYWYRT